MIILFFLLLLFFFISYAYIYFYKEILYLICYLLFGSFLFFTLTLTYSLDLLKYWFNNVEESLIIQDSSDIIWASCVISFFFCFIFIFPYFLWILFFFLSNSLTRKEKTLALILFGLLTYMEFLGLIIFLNDISASSFFVMPTLNSGFFELQIEIETYLNLIWCFFSDLIKSIFLYQIFLYLFFSNPYFYFNLKKKNLIFFLSSFLIFFYWFGGESLFSDFLLFITIFILTEFVYFLQLIVLNLRGFKLV